MLVPGRHATCFTGSGSVAFFQHTARACVLDYAATLGLILRSARFDTRAAHTTSSTACATAPRCAPACLVLPLDYDTLDPIAVTHRLRTALQLPVERGSVTNACLALFSMHYLWLDFATLELCPCLLHWRPNAPATEHYQHAAR